METNNKTTTTQIAVFGGGCFWCTEAVFKMMKGVTKVLPGYAGGSTVNPTYQEVSQGNTGHAEVVYIEYDPQQVKYHDLLTVFFGSHDPTTKNQQGADIGTQYRSVVFYTSPEQEKEAKDFIADMNAIDAGPLSQGSIAASAPVVTEVEPLIKFYEAENYHHDYFANHPNAAYCMVVINPKLEKVQKEYADLLTSLR